MALWKAAVAPAENEGIWQICADRGIIVIGWPQHRPEWDRNLNVRRFRDEMCVDDWVVAHLPGRLARVLPYRLDHLSGVSYLGIGLGRITGDYEEHVPDPREFHSVDHEVHFWRQRRICWKYLKPVSLRGVISGGTLTYAVAPLRDAKAAEVFRRYGMEGY